MGELAELVQPFFLLLLNLRILLIIRSSHRLALLSTDLPMHGPVNFLAFGPTIVDLLTFRASQQFYIGLLTVLALLCWVELLSWQFDGLGVSEFGHLSAFLNAISKFIIILD